MPPAINYMLGLNRYTYSIFKSWIDGQNFIQQADKRLTKNARLREARDLILSVHGWDIFEENPRGTYAGDMYKFMIDWGWKGAGGQEALQGAWKDRERRVRHAAAVRTATEEIRKSDWLAS